MVGEAGPAPWDSSNTGSAAGAPKWLLPAAPAAHLLVAVAALEAGVLAAVHVDKQQAVLGRGERQAGGPRPLQVPHAVGKQAAIELEVCVVRGAV